MATKGNVVQSKTASIARTDTTSAALFTLPSGAMVIGVEEYTATAADSQTSSTVTVETRPINSSTVTTLATFDVKTAAGRVAATTTLAGAAYTRQSVPVVVNAKFSEEGTGASTGGPFQVTVYYI